MCLWVYILWYAKNFTLLCLILKGWSLQFVCIKSGFPFEPLGHLFTCGPVWKLGWYGRRQWFLDTHSRKRVSIFISCHCHKSPAQKLRLTPNIFEDNDITEIFCAGEVGIQNHLCVMPKQAALWLKYSVFPGDTPIMGVMDICLIFTVLFISWLSVFNFNGGLDGISGCCNTVVGF